MASLNATDANMPVALESFDECANNPNEEIQMATDDGEKANAENDENRIASDTRIDELDDNDNDHNASHAEHKTMEHIASLKGLISSAANDQVTNDKSQHQSVSYNTFARICDLLKLILYYFFSTA